MNSIYVNEKNEKFFSITKHDAVELIAFLAAQLGKTYIKNNCSGACPSIYLEENGKPTWYYFGINTDVKEVYE